MSDPVRCASDDRDLVVELPSWAHEYNLAPPMQRFPESDAKYAYSPDHASIGTVEPGERFEVDSVEGYSNYFRLRRTSRARADAAGEAHKWAVVGPIAVAGASAAALSR